MADNICCRSTCDAVPNERWITGFVETPIASVPQVSTDLDWYDFIGTVKVRLGINRMSYSITSGLYCVGTPDTNSPVIVTANYKLSFDSLRKELKNMALWILVLDTKGVNVWCAAGKGTFGTDEIVNRIHDVNLSEIVTHKTIILPQLSAPGVSKTEVQKRSGFKAIYGPIRASDIKEFIELDFTANTNMRRVQFNLYDRLILTPIEFIKALKTSLSVFGALFILNIFNLLYFGIVDFYSYIGALLIGCVIVPILLPWIPGRAFAWKGWLLGFMWAIIFNAMNGWPLHPEYSLFRALAYLFALPPVSAYYSMAFTGASTYTSFSGVSKETRIAVPLLSISAGIGIILFMIDGVLSKFM